MGVQSLKGTETGAESDAACRLERPRHRAPRRRNLQQEEQRDGQSEEEEEAEQPGGGEGEGNEQRMRCSENRR